VPALGVRRETAYFELNLHPSRFNFSARHCLALISGHAVPSNVLDIAVCMPQHWGSAHWLALWAN